jgi:predicted phosphodiesterase
MKTLIFSDTHFHKAFDEKKYNFLTNIIHDADTIIIAGDFWEGYLMSFSDFLSSEWKRLFPLLKEKNTIYVIGNHDHEALGDRRTGLFSSHQTRQYILSSYKKRFIIEHGDRLAVKLSSISKIAKTIVTHPLAITFLHTHFESFLINTIGKKFYQKRFYRFNKIIKKRIRRELAVDDFFICGHTHAAELDLQNNFANTGMVRHGLGQYILIENGTVQLKETWYDRKG